VARQPRPAVTGALCRGLHRRWQPPQRSRARWLRSGHLSSRGLSPAARGISHSWAVVHVRSTWCSGPALADCSKRVVPKVCRSGVAWLLLPASRPELGNLQLLGSLQRNARRHKCPLAAVQTGGRGGGGGAARVLGRSPGTWESVRASAPAASRPTKPGTRHGWYKRGRQILGFPRDFRNK
jgi:hypothetical protein